MSTSAPSSQPQTGPDRRWAWRLGAAMLALAGGIAALVVVILLVHTTLG